MLHVFNSLSRKKEPFSPLHPPFVGIYVCGPTVYDEPHLGHAKSYISFDVIVRFLRASGYRVRYVQNITDVGHLLGDFQEGEDRILRKARLEQKEPAEVAYYYEVLFFRAMDELNCLRPDISCRATGHMIEMQELTKILLQKGYAYEVNGNVYFEVAKFPSYGKLSGKKLEELLEGVRVEVAEGKRHPSDFALWKKADPHHLMQWPSPWGMGFPGWHLECSTMAMKYLGESIDIHGGGLDNQFPHHECEIAQSEAATGKPFVKYWLHNNMVTIHGQKMSKSLGNFITLTELLKKRSPMAIRFFILQGHYRSPQDFSEEALDAAEKGFERLKRTVLAVREKRGSMPVPLTELSEKWLSYRNRFFDFLNDDFHTAGGVSMLFDLAKEANVLLDSGETYLEEWQAIDTLFTQLGEEILGLTFASSKNDVFSSTESEIISFLIELRNRFRQEKQFALADEIRNRLSIMGILLEDRKDGTIWRRK